MTHKDFKESIKKQEEWRKKYPFLDKIKCCFYSIKRFVRDTQYWHYYIKWFIQRLFTGKDSRQPCDLHSYFAKIMLPKLKYYRKNMISYPGNITFKEWKVILGKIIWSLERVKKDDILIYENKSGKIIKRSHKIIDKLEKKEQNGLELLGKYFIHLWD